MIRTDKKQLNNTGSTLVTILVGVGFLMILAFITISVSAANLHMKQVEYAMKDNFYADEQILDDVYNGIGKVTTDCLSNAYADVLSQVSDSEGGAVFTTQDAAYRAFALQFMKNLTADGVMPVCSKNDSDKSKYDSLLARLNAYITKDEAMAEVVEFSRTEILDEEGNPLSSYLGGAVPGRYVFRDVVVKYKQLTEDGAGGFAETGYESVITTDIAVEVPYINFFRDSSILLDYALIGNKGIYFEGGSREIEGNVYAGINTVESPEYIKKFRDEDVYGGINIYNSTVEFDSNYLISKGDINLRNAVVTIGKEASDAGTQLWAESLRTVENINKNAPEEETDLLINGNMYIANDLELNARKSNVTLNGVYYGYSNKVFETQETKSLKDKYVTAEHTQSSSIIINGNQSRLDLSGLNTLVVAGVAYVDLQSQAYAGEAINNAGGNSAGKIEEYATGESLALRSSQYMYLAPTVCLACANPVRTSEIPENVWIAESQWFGTNKGYVSPENPLIAKEVINRTTGEAYTYFYLNFLSGKQDDYANLVLNMIDPENDLAEMDPDIRAKFAYDTFDELELDQIWEIKKSIQSKALSSSTRSTIELLNDTSASIYTRGVITQISDDKLSSWLPDEASALSVDYINKVEYNMVKHYQYLCAELNPKEDFSLVSDSLPALSETPAEDAPVSKFVDFTGIVDGSESPDYKCGYKTHVYNGNFVLNDSNFKGIILCDGDVTITGGSSVEGLVISSGKIVIEGDGKIIANRSIVQAILDEERTEESKKKSETEKNMKYASTYLKEFRLDASDYSGKDRKDRISSTDYTDYISYQNWRKGEA